MGEMTAEDLTQVVLERYSQTPDARLRELLLALIRHSHAFVREARLTEEEWLQGILFLTRVGQKCDEKRQEMILLSDNLGISALVNLVSANVPAGATESTVVGPFYVPNTPQKRWGESIVMRKTAGEPLVISGRVMEMSSKPVGNAQIEVWQTDPNGLYDIQDPKQPPNNLRGTYQTRDDGTYRVVTVRPASYSIPTDGPVGDLLNLTARHPWRPAHVHFRIAASGYKPLTTHIFDSEDPYLDSDVVFAVKDSLVSEFQRSEDAALGEELGVHVPFRTLNHDFLIVPES